MKPVSTASVDLEAAVIEGGPCGRAIYGCKNPDTAVRVFAKAEADVVVLAFEIPDFDDIPDVEVGKDGSAEWEVARVAGKDCYAVYTYGERVENMRVTEF